MAYDGVNILADYNGSNALQHRYVFGAGTDAPIVEYDASGNRTFLAADERGSIIARTSSSGALVATNTYDEYGIPGSANAGLFQYTGQAYIPQIGLYYYKARMYSPTSGRFMQTDPIGYADGPNWYAYVKNDPINHTDPAGFEAIIVVGTRFAPETQSGGGDAEGTPGCRPQTHAVLGNVRCDGATNASSNVSETGVKKKNEPPSPDYCGSKGSEGVPDGIWGGACKKHDDCYGTPGNSKGGCGSPLRGRRTVGLTPASPRSRLPSILIPRGSRLVGRYQADIGQSQKRAVIDWTRLIRPDGLTIAVDALGRPTYSQRPCSGSTERCWALWQQRSRLLR